MRGETLDFFGTVTKQRTSGVNLAMNTTMIATAGVGKEQTAELHSVLFGATDTTAVTPQAEGASVPELDLARELPLDAASAGVYGRMRNLLEPTSIQIDEYEGGNFDSD